MRHMWTFLAALALSTQLAAQPQQTPTVSARGEAIVTAQPDQVRIDIGVISQAASAQEAAAANAKQLSAVLAELKKTLGPTAEIRTTNYSLNPNYRHDRTGGNPTITGYTANNTVQVVMPDVKAAGKIIDAAARTGANNIHSIQFTLKDEQAARTQALREAATQARTNAEALASAVGLKVVRVLNVNDGQPVTIHPVRQEYDMAQMSMAKTAAPTPMEPGTIRVHATATVTLEVSR